MTRLLLGFLQGISKPQVTRCVCEGSTRFLRDRHRPLTRRVSVIGKSAVLKCLLVLFINQPWAAAEPKSPTPPGASAQTSMRMVAKQLRAKLPRAVGFPVKEFEEAFPQDGSTPRVSNFAKTCQAPSMLALVMPIRPLGMYAEHQAEFQGLGTVAPKPSDIMEELARCKRDGFFSIIQPDRITSFTCEISGGNATGVVAYKVPELFKGELHYKAVRIKSGAATEWEFVEFSLPIHQWAFRRQPTESKWTWHSSLGIVDLENGPERFEISGRLLQDGAPIPSKNLRFYHNADPFGTTGYGQTDQDGNFTIRVPKGEYSLIITVDELLKVATDSRGRKLIAKDKPEIWRIDTKNGQRIDLDREDDPQP